MTLPILKTEHKKNRHILRRIAFVLTAALCLLCLCACDLGGLLEPVEPTEKPTAPSGTEPGFTLSYRTDDSLDPHFCTGRTNSELAALMYDKLLVIGSDYTPSGGLCSGWETDGQTVTLTLRDDIFFSDGSRFTSADCDYSFKRAKSSPGIYSSRFSRIISWNAVSDFVFSVTFSTENEYNVNLLDIPVIKNGTGSAPIGTGRFIRAEKDGEQVLVQNYLNPASADGDFPINTIKLQGADSAEDQIYDINYGVIHLLYSDLSNGSSSMRGNIELVRYTDNSLIFAVLNTDREYFADPNAALGILYCINRQTIVHDTLSNTAEAVWYPFCPAWNQTRQADLNRDIYSSVLAHESFTAAGLTLKGLKRTWKGADLELTLLVNSESRDKMKVAENIADDLRNMGFSATVKALKQKDFDTAVANGDYDIYFSKEAIPANMDFSGLMSGDPKGQIRYTEELKAALSEFLSGKTDMRSFLGVFRQQLPFIPICYTRSALAVNRLASGNFTPGPSELYTGIEKWTFNEDDR